MIGLTPDQQAHLIRAASITGRLMVCLSLLWLDDHQAELYTMMVKVQHAVVLYL